MSITGSEQWMYSSGAAGFYNFPIEQSLRFEDGDSAYLSRTPSSASNRKTWTFSAWIKLGSLSQGERGTIFQSNYGGPTIYQDSGLRFAHAWDPAGTDYIRETVAVFRDPSAWYHVVWWCDTTQAGTRWKIYVNGVEQSLQTPSGNNGEPAQNTDLNINSTNAHTIGNFIGNYFDGYMAEVNFVDGSAYTADSFGELKSGIWIPKDTAGLTFGTNGFRLQFGDSAAIGDDTSGNTNDWTVNNLVASDVVLDSPTNNFATMNILDDNYATPKFTYSEGNLKYTYGYTGTGFDRVFGTIAISPDDTNKYYFEFTGNVTNEQMQWGVVSTDSLAYSIADRDNGPSATANASQLRWVSYLSAPYLYRIDSSTTSEGTLLSTSNGNAANGAIYSIVYDAGAGKFYAWFNGVEFTGQDYEAGTSLWATMDTSKTYMVMMYQGDGGVTTKSGNMTANFGADSSFAGAKTRQGNTDANGLGDFYYTVPQDALALCSSNLPSGAIDTLNDETPEDYFNTLLWTGDGSNPRTLSGLDFAADLIWHKSRSSASLDSHVIQDVVRGFDLNNNLYTNLTAAETTYPNRGVINSVSSTGFTFNENASDYSAADGLNQSGVSFVAWNWKAGGAGVSNTDGSITSTVSVGATSQQNWFSIVKWVSTTSTADTVGHGLNTVPKLIITKNRDITQDWWTYTTAVDGTYDGLKLNLTNASYDASSVAAPTSSVFSNVNTGGAYNNVAYCFANAENLCKVGTYVGNGNTGDGTFVWTGFRPSFLLIKRTDAVDNWPIEDNERNPSNLNRNYLLADTNGAEGTVDLRDFLSNGFKMRGSAQNASGGNYIYLAIAEQPFKFANAR